MDKAPLNFSSFGRVLPGVAQQVAQTAKVVATAPVQAVQNIVAASGVPVYTREHVDRVRAEAEAERAQKEQEKQQQAAASSTGQPRTDPNPMNTDAGYKKAQQEAPEAQEKAKAEDMAKLDLRLRIQHIANDPEFKEDLQRFGIYSKCSFTALEGMDLGKLRELKEIIDRALGMQDDTSTYWMALLRGAGFVERLSMYGFRRYGLVPLVGLQQQLFEDHKVRRLVKRYAIENGAIGSQSAGWGLVWELPRILYDRYETNHAKMVAQMAAIPVPQEMQDKYKDL